ncbi:MAG TPA: PQQ-binding-like beta-propeller repeat protein [Bacteroidales bacterium]|nr:PQQ-binding-like beta-propeller repeat protein [Bacteroidales bacterium]
MNNLAILFAITLLWSSSASEKIKIYEWRGKDRMGIYQDSNLLKEWPAEGPKEIWSIDNIGNGFVSPIFTEEHFFITGETDSITVLYCFNLKGEKQWKTILGNEWMKSYPESRTATTIVDNLIYVGTGMGNLYCLERDNGKLVWSKDLIDDFHGALPLHGHSEAPLIDGEKIFWNTGGRENNVVALNRFTGKLIWSNKGLGERSADNPPKLIELPDRHILVTFSAYHLMGFDTGTGKLLWAHEQDNLPLSKRTIGYGDSHCNTVLYDNGSIYYAAGDDNCGVKLNLSKDGTKITEVWRNKGFDSFMGGIVKIGDYLYGSGTVSPDIRSINATSGKLTDSLRIGSGAIIAADNMLYYYTQKGDLKLFSYNQGKLHEVSSFRIKKGRMQHFSHPVINKGVLYQRHGNVLMAFDIRKK